MALGYRTVDIDNHYYETRDAFTRHIESRFAERTLRVERDEAGDRMVIDGRRYRFSDPKFERTNPPGSLLDHLRDPNRGDYSASFTTEAMLPGFQERTARLALMDAQGLEAAVLLPSLAVCVEVPIRHDPELTDAVLRAFNRWVEDDWGYGADGRIFGVPLISLLDVELACRELRRVLEAGARMVHLTAGPVDGRSPGDPHFDAFWSIVNEAQIAVAFHIGDAGYSALFGAAWGEDPDPNVRKMTAFQWAFLHGDMPLMQTLGALVYNNFFGRFPNVRIISIENGSDWVGYLLHHLDKKKGMGRQGNWLGGYFRGRPSEILKRHLYVAPYPEDDVEALIGHLGADHVLFGSDYPHPEGLAEPNEFVALLPNTSEADRRLVMRSNAAALLGLSA